MHGSPLFQFLRLFIGSTNLPLIALSPSTALWEETNHSLAESSKHSHELTYGRQKLPSEGSVVCPNATSEQGSNTSRVSAQRTSPNLAIPPRKLATCHIPNSSNIQNFNSYIHPRKENRLTIFKIRMISRSIILGDVDLYDQGNKYLS